MTTTVTSVGVSSAYIILQNGSYGWSVTTTWANYSTGNATGNVQIHGAPRTVAVTFVASVLGQYFVTFDESSLPVGTTWYVNITREAPVSMTVKGAGTSSVSISLGNGTYDYNVATNAATWSWNDSSTGTSVQVSGAPRTVTLQFNEAPTQSECSVTFSEMGLPSGVRFTVLIDDHNLTVAAPSELAIQLSNGSYAFTADNVGSYVSNLTSGTVIVEGQSVSVRIAFSGSSSPPSPSGSSNAFPRVWAVVGVLSVIALLALFFFLAGRRRKKEEPPPKPSPSGADAAQPPGPGDGSA